MCCSTLTELDGFRSLLSKAKHILDLSLYWTHRDKNDEIMIFSSDSGYDNNKPKKLAKKCSFDVFHALFFLFVPQPTPLFLAAVLTT